VALADRFGMVELAPDRVFGKVTLDLRRDTITFAFIALFGKVFPL